MYQRRSQLGHYNNVPVGKIQLYGHYIAPEYQIKNSAYGSRNQHKVSNNMKIASHTIKPNTADELNGTKYSKSAKDKTSNKAEDFSKAIENSLYFSTENLKFQNTPYGLFKTKRENHSYYSSMINNPVSMDNRHSLGLEMNCLSERSHYLSTNLKSDLKNCDVNSNYKNDLNEMVKTYAYSTNNGIIRYFEIHL